jgi:hypothetical protein
LRIAANLIVKDEVELIDATIHHLWSIGVEAVVACDLGSTDGTLELLEKHQKVREFLVIRLTEKSTTQEWSQANLEVVNELGVEWVIFVDADEYPLPATGSLRECPELKEADVLIIDRFNIPLGTAGPFMPHRLLPSTYHEVGLFVEPIPDFRNYWIRNPETPWTRNVPAPKVMARAQRIAAVADGCHSIVPTSGPPLRRAKAQSLITAHLPFTSRSRFARKIDNIRRVFEIHGEYMGADLGWHWRRWLALADQGRLDEEFERNVFSAEMVTELRAIGVIRSAAEILRMCGGA